MDYKRSLLYLAPGPFVMFIGCVLDIVGFSTPNWSVDLISNAGLWKMCHGLSPMDKQRLCYHYSERDHLPLMAFVCSAFATIGLILVLISTAWALFSVLQNTQRSKSWLQRSGTVGLSSVVFNLFAVCIYAGSYKDISYDMIPKWSGTYDMKLSWSFTICCCAMVLSLIGSTLSIYMALKFSSVETINSNVSHTPSLHIHPPPSSRVSTPPRFVQRAASPLPFSTKKYPSHGYPKRMPTVNIT